ERKFRRGAGARRIFPLGLGQESIGFPGLLRKPRQICLRIVPGYVDDGTPSPAPLVIVRFRVGHTAAVGRARAPFVERHLELADREGLRDGDLMGRLLMVAALGRLQREWAGRYFLHLWTV